MAENTAIGRSVASVSTTRYDPSRIGSLRMGFYSCAPPGVAMDKVHRVYVRTRRLSGSRQAPGTPPVLLRALAVLLGFALWRRDAPHLRGRAPSRVLRGARGELVAF